MRKFIADRAVIIAISMSFFVFDFSMIAHMVEMTGGEVLSGILSGIVWGTTVLLVTAAHSDESKEQLRQIFSRFLSPVRAAHPD